MADLPLAHAFEHVTFAKTKQGHLLVSSMQPEELTREWTPISEKEYAKLLAHQEADMLAHAEDYAATLRAEATDRAQRRQAAAAKLGLTVDELSALIE
jgi:hypothetical protein